MAKQLWEAEKKENSPGINLSTWSWGGEFDRMIGEVVSTALRETFERRPPNVCLNYRFVGNGDAASLIIDLPLGEMEDENPEWTISLSDVVDDVISVFHRPGLGSVSREDGEEFLMPTAYALRELADRLENSIEAKS